METTGTAYGFLGAASKQPLKPYLPKYRILHQDYIIRYLFFNNYISLQGNDFKKLWHNLLKYILPVENSTFNSNLERVVYSSQVYVSNLFVDVE